MFSRPGGRIIATTSSKAFQAFALRGVVLVTVIFAILALVGLHGCEGDARHPREIEKSEVGRVPVFKQRPGDSLKGYDALLNRPVVTCGLPYDAYRKGAIGPAHDARTLNFPGRTGRNADLPYMLTSYLAKSGIELVTSNCLGCHATPIEGELVMGLGNEFLDMTLDPLVAVERAEAFVSSGAMSTEWRRWADRVTLISPYMMTDTVGVNSASNLTQALMAHRDARTLAWSGKPVITPPPEKPLPVSVPPWWNLRKKNALYYNAEGRGDQVGHMGLASLLCIDSVEEAASIDVWLVDVRAYLATLEAPKYPYPIDRNLAVAGQIVFANHCEDCHGSDGEDVRSPNEIVALGRIKTDPELARRAYTDADRFRRWFADSFYGKRAQVAPALGYIAPPLDGIWATAPYLHNGSVPTLEALLDSDTRPLYWQFDRVAETTLPAYDQRAVGWAFSRLRHGKAGAMSWVERHRIYDSSLPGYGNRGHAFGDVLSSRDRKALIEYLKTL